MIPGQENFVRNWVVVQNKDFEAHARFQRGESAAYIASRRDKPIQAGTFPCVLRPLLLLLVMAHRAKQYVVSCRPTQ